MNWTRKPLLFLLLLSSLNVSATEKVVSALPILHGLSAEILEGTDIEAVYLPPKRLPVSRISNWLQHKSSKSISGLESITALVTVESVRPEYALFSKLRVNNVRVIPIDVANEIHAGGARLSLSEHDLKTQSYFWLLPDNLIVMSQIMAREYSRIWPEQSAKIKTNQVSLQKQIREYALQLDQLLLEQEVGSICLNNPLLEPLAQATYLPIEEKTLCSDNALRIEQLKRSSQPVPGKWFVDSGDRPLRSSVYEWLQANISRLQQALY